MDYRLVAWTYGFDEFDCELFIPDVDNLVMNGNALVLPPHVLKMLDEKHERDGSRDESQGVLPRGRRMHVEVWISCMGPGRAAGMGNRTGACSLVNRDQLLCLRGS